MSVALSIALFEIRQRLRRISTWVYCVVFFAMAVFFVLAAGGAITGANVEFGTGGKVFINSPYSLQFLVVLISLFGTVILSSIAGQATFQDLDHRISPLFFTAPISKRQYLGGRYLGGFFVCVMILAAIGVGAAFATQLPMLDPSRVGPPPGALAYLQPYLTVLLPNLYVTFTLFFCLAALTRRMLPVYAGAVVLMIGYLIALNLSDDVENKTLISMLDPFGFLAGDRLTEYWTVVERNTRRVPLEGILLANRALWVGLATALLAFTYLRFSFTRTDGAAGPKGRAKTEEKGVQAPAGGALVLPKVTLDFSTRASVSMLWKLTRLQWRETVKSVVFLIIVLAGVLYIGSASQSVGRLFGTTTWPVTWEVLELIGGAFTSFIFAIVIFYSGELVWRERDAKLSQIQDALPTPRWVIFTSKWLALVGVQVLLLSVILVSGVLIQTLKGYHHYELGLYLRWLFGLRLIDMILLCTLALMVHVIVNQKYAGHFAMVGYFIAMLSLPLLGFEHRMIRFNSGPDWSYSDMNGFGHFVGPLICFKLYWASLALVMAVASNLLWVRGVDTGWRHRLRLARQRLSPASIAAGTLGLLAFASVGAYLFWNLDVRNHYRTKFEKEELQAKYEKQFKAAYGKLPQPRVTAVSVQADIFPSERRLALRGTFQLENKSKGPIDRIAITLSDELKIEKLWVGRGQTTLVDDPLGFHVFALAAPLQPGERTALEFAFSYAPGGIENGGTDRHVVENGTFFNNNGYLPTIGYVEGAELTDDSVRKKHGLGDRPRMRDLDDPEGLANSYVSQDADWVSFDATVSTSPDQIAIAPGYLQKEWTQDGRRYFHYAMDAKILNFYSFISARYAVKKDRWKDVAIEIYYHPAHDYDVDRMIAAVKDSLETFTTAFGPYQHRQVRIIEFPRYELFAQSFPNTIPYSEAIGFIARVDESKDDEIDYPTYITAHEVAHQWWAHQVIGGNVQGSTVLSESFSQYSALLVMKHRFGEPAMRKFLHYELDNYLRGRATERRKELPLLRVEDQGYIHYAKGGLAMYALQDAIGEEAVNRALRKFLEQVKYQGPPYTNTRAFLEVLRAEAPVSAAPLIHDLFEQIILYELRATSASAIALPDGKFEVTVKASAKKLQAGELGEEAEVPLDEEIAFGALDEKGHVLVLEKHRVKTGELEQKFIVASKPAKAGIDPVNVLIDRKPDDNVIVVEWPK